MLRRIAIASVIFTLAAWFGSIGPEAASSQSSSFRVIGDGYVFAGGSIYYLERLNAPYGWKALPYASLTLPPLDPSMIAFYDSFIAITDAGEGWGKVSGVWTDLGAVPGTPVQNTSWGQVKSRYLH